MALRRPGRSQGALPAISGDDLAAYEISTRVNNPGSDDPRVIEPMDHEQLGLGEFSSGYCWRFLTLLHRGSRCRIDKRVLLVPTPSFRFEEDVVGDSISILAVSLVSGRPQDADCKASVARGEADCAIDIDCFVLVSDEKATAQHRAHELAQELSEQRFDGDRFQFQVLVESSRSVANIGD